MTPLPISGAEAEQRIAKVLWSVPLDGALANRAPPTTTAGLADFVRGMLADPRATTGVSAFYRWWLWLGFLPGHDLDPTLFPEATPALMVDMAQETETFGVDVTLTLNGSFQTLMTAPFSFVNARLAAVYGLAGVAGDDLRRITLPPGRPGLLTRPAFLVLTSTNTRTSVVDRGRFVDMNFFCDDPPAPVPNEPPFPEPLPPGVTGSAAMKALIDTGSPDQPCHACHDLMDPIGDIFEIFDPIGRARTTDNGAPIDTSLAVVALSTPANAVVDGVSALVNLLANDPGAERCMAKKWLSFAIGRDLQPSDDPSVDQIVGAFASSKFNLQALITAVMVSPAFLDPSALAYAGPPQL
ncbi:MAG TPA: DUF1588 domain-containing protein [Polyangia bacterium]|nr:DUF1588 domain-containing protein [Polyangia bacterium]